ncbi:MAG: hypothetical protein AAB486_02560 [Patescibacteria group bacterium]
MGRRKIIYLSLALLVLAVTVWALKERSQRKVLGIEDTRRYLLLRNYPAKSLSIEMTSNLGENRQVASVYNLIANLSGLALIDYQNNFIEWLPEGKPYLRDNYFPVPGEYLDWFRFDNLGGSSTGGDSYFLVQYANTGTAGVHPFYLYSYGKGRFKLILKLIENSNKIEIRDLDGDIKEEIVHEYSLSGNGKMERDLLRWKDVWKLDGASPVKVNHLFPQEYTALINLYDLVLTNKEWEPDVHFYYPVLECLTEQALLTEHGQEVGVGECDRILHRL